MRRAVLLTLALVCCISARALAADCSSETTCTSCTETQSWDGEPCRWCPVDSACHAAGSLENPCSSAQNIVNPAQCAAPSYTYSEQQALQHFVFAAAAYSLAPQECMDNQNTGFELYSMYNVTCDDGGNTCAAFVAISTSKQAIVLAYRGSDDDDQLWKEFLSDLKPDTPFVGGGAVEEYWANAYKLLYDAVTDVKSLLSGRYSGYSLWITGHSLGAALGSLASTELGMSNVTSDVVFYSFGQPRVGDYDYAVAQDKAVKNSWRVVHYLDPVPHVPPCISVLGLCTEAGFYHTGTEVFYDEASMPTGSNYTVCHGLPHNEDNSCSDGKVGIVACIASLETCIDYHTYYFNTEVADWGIAGCKPSQLDAMRS